MMLKRFALVFLFLTLSPLTPLFAQSEEPIRIGAIVMLTGDQAVYGKALLQGIQLGLDEVNSSGPRRFELIVEDSQLTPKVANTAAIKLVKVDQVAAALNASFIESMANGKVFESAKVPVITLWDSATEIEQLGDYVFGIGLWTPSSAKCAADFAIADLKARTAAIVNTEAEWATTVGGLFEKYFQEREGKIVKHVSIPPTETDFRTSIHLIKSLEPDVLYAPLTENILPFYKQLRQAGFKKPIITSDIIAAEHIDQAPDLFEGVYQTNAPDPQGDINVHLFERYREKYGYDPKLPLFVAWGYDGFRLLATSLSNVNFNSAKLKDQLYTVQGFKGASSIISFNKEGSSPVIEKMFVIRKGKFERVN